jgi:hypothetical protein
LIPKDVNMTADADGPGEEKKIAGDTNKDKKIAGITAVIVFLICVAGAGVGAALIASADQSESCAPHSAQGSWKGLQISGLPDSLQLPFGYGRGTRTVQSAITVTASAGVNLPNAIPIFVEPLVTGDGSQMIPLTAPTTASEKSAAPSGTGAANASAGANAQLGTNQLVSATATQVASSSIYQIELCITTSNVAAGSYSGQLLFPGATLASGTSLPVTVTFQSRVVPFVLTVGGLPLALCGILYTTLILIRRNNPGLGLKGVVGNLYEELWSINGLVAFLLSVGAVFAAWYAQCFRDLTWGAPWPSILIAFGTMAGVAAGAATVPMGLSNASS